MLKRLTAIAFTIGLVLVGPPASADGGGGGGHGGAGIGDPGVNAWIAVGPVAWHAGTWSGGASSRYVYVVQEVGVDCTSAHPPSNKRWSWYLGRFDTVTQQWTDLNDPCAPAAGVYVGLVASPADIFRLEPIPAPGIGLNPGDKGLTGLETWGWYEGPQTVTVTVFLRGYEVTAVAHPTGYQWSFGDGATESIASPGSPSSPAVKHMYQTKGTYSVTLTATWSGSYTFTGDGVSGGGLLGSVSIRNSVSYPVEEVRSVLTG